MSTITKLKLNKSKIAAKIKQRTELLGAGSCNTWFANCCNCCDVDYAIIQYNCNSITDDGFVFTLNGTGIGTTNLNKDKCWCAIFTTNASIPFTNTAFFPTKACGGFSLCAPRIIVQTTTISKARFRAGSNTLTMVSNINNRSGNCGGIDVISLRFVSGAWTLKTKYVDALYISTSNTYSFTI